MDRIAVIGATGMLGTPVTNELFKAGYDVTAIVRNPKKAAKKLPDKIHRIQADLRNTGEVERALRGHRYVYLSLSTKPAEQFGSFQTEVDGVKNLIEASQKAGIDRIGYLSSLVKDYDGFDWWLFDVKREAVRLLKNAGIPATIFYPSNFYENFPYQQLMANRILLGGDQTTQSWWIGAEDYGKQVARSFRVLKDSKQDREYPIQGPKPYNFEEAADVFIDHYPHRRLKKLKVPMGILKFFGKFSREARFGVNILEAINHYDEQFQSEQAWEELGRPQVTLARYASSLK